jgi:hypothetical protein
MKQSDKRERAGLMMTIALLEAQFDNLALVFGRRDAAAADAALVMIEDEAARQLIELRNARITEGHLGDDNVIRKVAVRMSATIHEARMSIAMVARVH